jgi:Fe2+ or Zn2+ uptake regulation protein
VNKMKRERLPKGSLEVIELLEEKGALTQKEIIESLKQTKPRAVRYTVRQLLDRTVLINRANFEDMRSALIGINPEMENDLKDLIDRQKSQEAVVIS